MPALLTDAQVSHYVIVVQMNVRTGAACVKTDRNANRKLKSHTGS